LKVGKIELQKSKRGADPGGTGVRVLAVRAVVVLSPLPAGNFTR